MDKFIIISLFFPIFIIINELNAQSVRILGDFKNHYVGPKSISRDCKSSLKLFLNDFFRLEHWAIEMVDANAKIPTGILKGNLMDLGNFDECIAVKRPNAPSFGELYGKYCVGSISLKNFTHLDVTKFFPSAILKHNPNIDVFPKFALCVPDSCSARDLQALFDNYVKFNEDQCYTSYSSPALDGFAIFAIVCFAFVLFVAAASTVYDVYTTFYHKRNVSKLYVAFSFYTNGRKLFKIDNGRKDSLSCLNGIRSLSMTWIVLGHVYSAYVEVPLTNYVDVFQWMQSPGSKLVTGATFGVDTFLFVGGFLTVYKFFSKQNERASFNILQYYLHRYLRLTPSLAALLLANVALFKYFGSGPFWLNTTTYLVNHCRTNWLPLLTYVQNYVNPEAICIPQSWYLSVDMQLFILSPLILHGLRRCPRRTYSIIGMFAIVSIINNFIIAWQLELRATLVGQLNEYQRVQYITHYYFPTHTRMVPYYVGIILGDLVYRLKTSNADKIQIGKTTVRLLWLLSLFAMLLCIFVGHKLEFAEYNKVENALFMALAGPCWALAASWQLFACLMDLGEPINSFLSLPPFQILSRLCYAMYLIHYPFIMLTNLNQKHPQTFGAFTSLHKFCGDYLFSLFIATFWYLLFESPIIVIEQIFTEKDGRKKIKS